MRIEDTDKDRSTQEAVDAIFDGLRWLGLDGDDTPVLQSSRASRHAQVARELVERGAAYLCPVTPEELQDRRDKAELLQKKKATTHLSAEEARQLEELTRAFRSPWRDASGKLPAGAPAVVRLRMPDAGELTVEDSVQGAVSRRFAELDDLILLRSDGTPTYMLAVVVDDHDMGVTHVIRGDDHFLNTFRQLPIYMAMGWPQPAYAHLPLIHGPDGKKLSKRHGATAVEDYRDILGYLPEGLKNYLLRLGWSHGDEEIISETQAIAWFDLNSLNKAPARLDFAKLDFVNKVYMGMAEDGRLFELLLTRPELQGQGPDAMDRVRTGLPFLKTRAANLVQLAEQARFLCDIRPISLNDKQRSQLTEEALKHLSAAMYCLEELKDWNETAIKERLAQYCDQNNVSMGKIGPILRIVLTGGAPAPDIALVLALLGRNEAFARISEYSPARG